MFNALASEIDEPFYVGTFVTDEEGRIFVEGLILGDYKLIETVAHDQHQLLSEPFFFSITYHHQHHLIEIINYQTLVEILKVDHNGEVLTGATLQVLTYEDEELITEWVSTDIAHQISALTHGSYILREVAAPSGFVLMDDIIFEVTDAEEVIKLIAINEQTHLEILKVNELGQPLADAYFHILDYETESYIYSFVSTEYAHVLKGFAHGRFILREIQAPSGHVLMDDVIFEVTDTNQVIEIIAVNEWTRIEILKVNELGQSLADAYFHILDYETEDYIYSFISTEYAHILEGLAHGKYILSEIQAPSGYVLMEDLIFEVTDANKTIELVAANLQTRLEILKVDDVGQPLAGAYFHILNYETGSFVYSFTSTEYAHVLEGFAHGRFILREITAPVGFELAEDYIFEVTDTPETIYIEIINTRLVVTLPQAGHIGGINVMLIGAGVLLLVGGIYTYKRKLSKSKG